MLSLERLIDVAARDYPSASEILVSYPDQWQLVHTFRREDVPLYIAGFTPSRESPREDHFFGLPPEINRELTTHRLYKLFEPWPQPIIPVAWNVAEEKGRVLPGGHMRVQLHPLGQAQTWTGLKYGVLWEGYMFEAGRQRPGWQQELTTFWQMVEQDMGVKKILTQPHDPDFEGDYPEFLSQLGYALDPEFPQWWGKVVEK